jgi:hypothetical protein
MERRHSSRGRKKEEENMEIAAVFKDTAGDEVRRQGR